MTSNPTIFQKAMAEGDAYDEQLKELLVQENDPKEIFLEALGARMKWARSALLRPDPEASGGEDGYARGRSIRRSPSTARPRSSEAKRLHEWLDRPNLYVKIPATAAGPRRDQDRIAARPRTST